MLASSRMTGCNGGTQRTIYVSLRRDEGIPPYKYDYVLHALQRRRAHNVRPYGPYRAKNMCSSLMNQITNCVNQMKKLCLTHQQGGRAKIPAALFCDFLLF